MPLDVRKFVDMFLMIRQRAAPPERIPIATMLVDRPVVHKKPRPSMRNRPLPPQHHAASNM